MQASPLHFETGCRWRRTLTPSPTSDIVRIEQSEGVCVAAMANGYDSGFATCWPIGSRFVLDAFFDAWRALHMQTPERLLAAFERARERFIAEAPAVEDDDTPSAALLAVAIDGTKAYATWMSGDVALLARAGELVASTAPQARCGSGSSRSAQICARTSRRYPTFSSERLARTPPTMVRPASSRSI